MKTLKRRLTKLIAVTALIGGAGIGIVGSSASANNAWWYTGYYRNGYPTTQECFRVISGQYGVWYTQNVAYVNYGGTCNAQHPLNACWLTAQTYGRSGGTITAIGPQACNAQGSAIAQGNAPVTPGDTGLVSVAQFYNSNNGQYFGMSQFGP
jgi:hypothetical protein